MEEGAVPNIVIQIPGDLRVPVALDIQKRADNMRAMIDHPDEIERERWPWKEDSDRLQKLAEKIWQFTLPM